MPGYSTTSTGLNGVIGPAIITASQPALFVWCATARDRSPPTGGDANASALRTSDTCYIRGLKERTSLTTVDANTWRWRRIVFTSKDISIRGSVGNSPNSTVAETSNGWMRLLRNSASSTYGDAIQVLLFKGSIGIDWYDVYTAKVDTSRISVMSDRTRILTPQTSAGSFRIYKDWFSCNKNLVYGNDEAGESETGDIFSVTSKSGMGDLYVVDFISCATSTLSTTTAQFSPEATLYWHEK